MGIIALYDALHAAMQWYIACPGQANKLLPISADNVHDDRRLFDILVRSGVLTSAFDYRAFSDLVESAVYKNMSSFNYSALLTDIESVMKQLGVTPGTDSTALAVESCISGNH